MFLGLACCAACLAPRLARAGASADLIIRNAKIWTVDTARPEAEAVVVLGGRIVAVGSNQEADAWRGAQTRVVDAAGKRLLPGFNDAHVHFAQGGADLDNVQLNDAGSSKEMARRIAAKAASSASEEWITGGAWDETKWRQVALPTRDLIDRLTPNNPVAVDRYDGHMILANALVPKQAGITASTPDPAGGVIVRDRAGNPTGALKDAAADLVFKVIPPPQSRATPACHRARVESRGLTRHHERSGYESGVRGYRHLRRVTRRAPIDHPHLCRTADHAGR